MKFFEVVPSELFSPLASPNRILYADALDVLYAAYQENLKIREDVLYSMLRGRLEQELADATIEDEDIEEMVQNEDLDGEGDSRCHQHNKDNSAGHTNGGIQLLGNAQERADTVELHQHVVVHQDHAEEDRSKFD